MGKKIAGIFAIIVIISINMWLVNIAPPDIVEYEERYESITESSTTITTSNTSNKDTTTVSNNDGSFIEKVDEDESSTIDESTSQDIREEQSASSYVKSYKGIVNIGSAFLCAIILFDMFRPPKEFGHITNIDKIVIDKSRTENVDIKDSLIQRSNIGGEEPSDDQNDGT